VTQVSGTMINGIVNGQIPVAVMQSIGRLLIVFSLAVVIGLVLGYLIWQFGWIEDTLGFLIPALQSIPSIVWFPLAIIWFGLNDMAILFIVTIAAQWRQTMSASSGLHKFPQPYHGV